MGKRKLKNSMSLGEIGFAMKYEASKKTGDTLLVSKKLWLEIAELLIETGSDLKAIEKELEDLVKGDTEDGKE